MSQWPTYYEVLKNSSRGWFWRIFYWRSTGQLGIGDHRGPSYYSSEQDAEEACKRFMRGNGIEAERYRA